MPLRRVVKPVYRRTSPRHREEDVVMSEATTSTVDAQAPLFPSPLAPSRSINGSSSLGKRRRNEQSSSEHASKLTLGRSSTTTTLDRYPEEIDIPYPLASPTHTSIPDTFPLKRPSLALNLIDDAFTNIPELSSSSTTHCPEPASPAATEIAYDISYVEQSSEERMESLLAAGVKVRDFAYEPTPNSSKAPEVFDPVPCLIGADWHMRNPYKNYGLISPKGLFRLIKMGWLTLADVRMNFHPREYVALAEYNERPDEQRYPFIVVAPNESIPSPSQRVRLRRQAGLCSYPDDVPDSEFFGYDPTGFSDDEGEEEEGPRTQHSPTPPMHRGTPTSAETASASGVVEAEVLVAEEPKAKRRKVRGIPKTRSRAKPKPLRREFSRPEV